MADESIMGGSDIGKNMRELTTFIDSVRKEQDSIHVQTITPFKNTIYVSTFQNTSAYRSSILPVPADTIFNAGFEAYFNNLPPDDRLSYFRQAKKLAEQLKSDYDFRVIKQTESQKQLLAHVAQYYKRYSLSLSCILFFFIGASLGAIIRKGGLGMPAVISVLLYVLYYAVDTFGTKVVQQAVLPAWEGAWLSTLLLLSLGIFFTYKAVNDSTMIDSDSWKVFFHKLIGKREMRNYVRKEIIMTPPDYLCNINFLKIWNAECENYLRERRKPPFYNAFWKNRLSDPELSRLVGNLENTIEDLLNSSENLIIGKLMDYPVIHPLNLKLLEKPAVRIACEIVFPIGLIIYGIALWKQRQVNNDLTAIRKMNHEMIVEIEKVE
jgi:lipopolysaccharide export system permease protein